MEDDIFLGVDIFLHILMDIEVIRCEVSNNGDIGAFTHRDKLEA